MKDVSAKVFLIQASVYLNHLVNTQWQYKSISDHAQKLLEQDDFVLTMQVNINIYPKLTERQN